MSARGASRAADAPRTVAVLGSTGSIGRQTLDVARRHPDKLRVVALACHSNVDVLLAQARTFHVRHVALGNAALARTAVAADLKEQVSSARRAGDEACAAPFAGGRARAVAQDGAFAADARASEPSAGFGAAAVEDLARLSEVDVVVNALVGAAGLRASIAALEAGKVLALANKESLVVGGDLIMPLAEGVRATDLRAAASLRSPHLPGRLLVPIDSEHGAIFQCLIGENGRDVARLWVTASGGPFLGRTRADLQHITPQQALKHPTWNMGAKISIDSSTLMNKGLEVIEAHHLFSVDYDRIRVVVQPQSAIHSMVEFSDGSVKAHLGTTDMRIPIQYALSWPERWEAPVEPLDFTKIGSLDFAAPDTDTFRCLALARAAGEAGGTLPCAMNAANEVAVAAFLGGQGSYLGIAACVEAVMEACANEPVESLEQLLAVDAWARAEAASNLR